MIQKDELYLITGGTGVVGQALCSRILYMGGKVRVMSRTGSKLHALKEKYSDIEIQIGDVLSDYDVTYAHRGVKGVFHLAALAQSMQSGGASASIQTNILGSINVLNESLPKNTTNHKLDFVLGVSSDKAVNVSGPYGATKFLMERLFDEYQEKNKKTR